MNAAPSQQPSAGAPAVELRQACARLGEFQLGPLDLVIPQGAYWGLCGPSGSGKTRLLELIAGLLPLHSGGILLAGADASAAAPERRAVGFVYQDVLLFPHLSVEANIIFARHARPRQRRRHAAPRLEELAQELQLTHLLHRAPGDLSGGERQRVALARALFRLPRLLLLDEPLSALDDTLRQQVQELLLRLHARYQITILQTAHRQDDLAPVKACVQIAAGRLLTTD